MAAKPLIETNPYLKRKGSMRRLIESTIDSSVFEGAKGLLAKFGQKRPRSRATAKKSAKGS